MVYEIISWSEGIGVDYERVPTKADVRGFMSDWLRKLKIDKVTVTAMSNNGVVIMSRKSYVRGPHGDWVIEGQTKRRKGRWKKTR